MCGRVIAPSANLKLFFIYEPGSDSAFVRTRIWYISIKLRFDLGVRGLWFASASNFELVPRFAEICMEIPLSVPFRSTKCSLIHSDCLKLKLGHEYPDAWDLYNCWELNKNCCELKNVLKQMFCVIDESENNYYTLYIFYERFFIC